jgi:hypothetical protein
MVTPKLSYMKNILILLVFTAFLPLSSLSQPFRFGRVTTKDLDLEYYREKYPDQPAVVIGEIGDCRFIYNSSKKTFEYRLDYTKRILILNDIGKDLGDIHILYYATRDRGENIRNFQANVYNLQGGKVKRERVNFRTRLEERLGNNYHLISIPLPSVVPGTIIEYKYTLDSPFTFFLRPWQYQYLYPLEYSEFSIRLPGVFRYRLDQKVRKDEYFDQSINESFIFIENSPYC